MASPSQTPAPAPPELGIALLGFSPQAARAAWTAAVVLILLYAVYQIRETIFIFVLATFVSYMVYPLVALVERHTRRRASRTGSVALVYLLVMVCVVLALFQVGSQMVSEASRLATELPATIQDPHWVDRIPIPDVLHAYKDRLLDLIRTEVTTLSENAVPIAKDVGTQLLSYAGNVVFVVLIPILSFLLSKDAPDIRQSALDLFEAGPVRRLWENILSDLNVLLAGYIRALLLLSVATFLVFSIFLSLVGVPYSVLFGMLAAVLEFIPMLGPLAAATTVLVVSAFSGFPHMLWLVLFFVGYRLFEDYVLSPLLMSSGVELSPLWVIFGVLAGEHLGGVPAMVLSIPVIAAAKIVAVRLREISAQPIAAEVVAESAAGRELHGSPPPPVEPAPPPADSGPAAVA